MKRYQFPHFSFIQEKASHPKENFVLGRNPSHFSLFLFQHEKHLLMKDEIKFCLWVKLSRHGMRMNLICPTTRAIAANGRFITLPACQGKISIGPWKFEFGNSSSQIGKVSSLLSLSSYSHLVYLLTMQEKIPWVNSRQSPCCITKMTTLLKQRKTLRFTLKLINISYSLSSSRNIFPKNNTCSKMLDMQFLKHRKLSYINNILKHWTFRNCTDFEIVLISECERNSRGVQRDFHSIHHDSQLKIKK